MVGECVSQLLSVSVSYTHRDVYKRQYPWPVIRLADLYLAYAEACIEIGTSDGSFHADGQSSNAGRNSAKIPDKESLLSPAQ